VQKNGLKLPVYSLFSTHYCPKASIQIPYTISLFFIMLKRSLAFVEANALKAEHEIQIAKKPLLCRHQKSIELAHQTWTGRQGETVESKIVKFSQFVQCRPIPSLHEQEKKILYYSQDDYRKFEAYERRRRDVLVLTIRLAREQKKRVGARRALISFPRVVTMYHCILSRNKNNRMETKVELKDSTQQAMPQQCVAARAA
jgi:hypothetical protein